MCGGRCEIYKYNVSRSRFSGWLQRRKTKRNVYIIILMKITCFTWGLRTTSSDFYHHPGGCKIKLFFHVLFFLNFMRFLFSGAPIEVFVDMARIPHSVLLSKSSTSAHSWIKITHWLFISWLLKLIWPYLLASLLLLSTHLKKRLYLLVFFFNL